MPRIGVIGGGPAGLATAMMAAERGWDAVVFERDASPVPADAEGAWLDWERHAVSQFRMAHTVLPLGASILRDSLPGVIERMFAAGSVEWSGFDFLPPGAIEKTPEDARFSGVGARRPVYELAFAAEADAHDRVAVRRGLKVEALVRGEAVAQGVRHVVGVRTAAGDEMFDVVIDAGGRRSRVPELIEAIGGARPREIAEDSRFTYYGRHYHNVEKLPRPFTPNLTLAGSFGVLTLPGDNDTWSTTIYTATSDKQLSAVRDPAVFERVVSSVPQVASWVEGDPISDVEAMSGVLDRQRDYVVDGSPIVTGVLPVGDAWACTNPSSGRGISFALLHVIHTVEAIADNADDPLAQTLAWDEATTRHLQPWHTSTLASDRRMVAALTAASSGEQPPIDDRTKLFMQINAAAPYDAEIFRWLLEMSGCFTLPEELLARPGVIERIKKVAAAIPAAPPPRPMPRVELEKLLAG